MKKNIFNFAILFCFCIKFQLFSQGNIKIDLADSLIFNTYVQREIKILYDSAANLEAYKVIPGSKKFQIKLNDTTWVNLPLTLSTVDDGYDFYEYAIGEEEIQTLDLFRFFYHQFEDFVEIINNGGNLEIRYSVIVIVDASLSRTEINSNSIILNLPPLSGTDISALNYLIQIKDTFPEFDDITSENSYPITIYNISVCDTIIQNYPNSVISQYARIKLALYTCSNYNFVSLPSDLKLQVEQTYNELLSSPLPPIKTLLGYIQECLSN